MVKALLKHISVFCLH